MQDRTIRVALRTDIINKANDDEKKRLGNGWSNREITVQALIEHIAQGFPFGPQWSGGKRDNAHFIGTDLLIADIDKGKMTLEAAVEHPFVQSNATFIYTTPTHTPELHHFRIVFVLDRRICDSEVYSALYRSLLKELPTDPATGTGASLFYGSKGVNATWIGKSLPETLINNMLTSGMAKTLAIPNPKVLTILTDQTTVKVKGGGWKELVTLPSGTSIHCPFGTHADRSPSAFVKVNKQDGRGVECRSCGQSAWVKSTLLSTNNFDTFDRIVRENAGKANSHFEYVGLTGCSKTPANGCQ